MSSNTRGTGPYAGTINVSVPSSPVKRSNFTKKPSSNANKPGSNTSKANNTANKSNTNATKTNNAPAAAAKPQTTPEFHFELDKMTTEQMIMEIEKSQAEDDDQPLLTIQRSQTETNIEEKALVRCLIVCIVTKCAIVIRFRPICP
ncbi:hypothetical protein Aduo_014081 [Ancylostoma duodenale]